MVLKRRKVSKQHNKYEGDLISRNNSNGTSTKPSSSISWFNGIQESTQEFECDANHDDIELINASPYLQICEIRMFAKDHINSVYLKYRLPHGQFVESLHTTKEKWDFYDSQILKLAEDEHVNHITWAYTAEGITRLGFKTNQNQKIIIEGDKINENSDNQKSFDVNLEDEGKFLIGMRTSFDKFCMTDLAWYTSTLKESQMDTVIEQKSKEIMTIIQKKNALEALELDKPLDFVRIGTSNSAPVEKSTEKAVKKKRVVRIRRRKKTITSFKDDVSHKLTVIKEEDL